MSEGVALRRLLRKEVWEKPGRKERGLEVPNRKRKPFK